MLSRSIAGYRPLPPAGLAATACISRGPCPMVCAARVWEATWPLGRTAISRTSSTLGSSSPTWRRARSPSPACARESGRRSSGPGRPTWNWAAARASASTCSPRPIPRCSSGGVDFHPGQIANAQRLAQAAGQANVVFEDLSFAQVLDLPEGRIPRCDVIALHGVLSWVSPENRALIVRILDRHLKPGGLAMVSYNTLPAWAPLMPLRQFVKAHFDRTSGPPQTRVMDAFRAAKELVGLDGRMFGGSAQAKALIEASLKNDPAYLIHEYMNDHFHPLYHADVARELEDARLTFAASHRTGARPDQPGRAAAAARADTGRDRPRLARDPAGLRQQPALPLRRVRARRERAKQGRAQGTAGQGRLQPDQRTGADEIRIRDPHRLADRRSDRLRRRGRRAGRRSPAATATSRACRRSPRTPTDRW